MVILTEYDKGETAVISCEIKDEDGDYTSPDGGVVITIVSDNTTLVSETTMTLDGTGLYHYDYLTTQTGRHYIFIKATQISPSRITIKPDTFEVIESY